jgi:sugar lactone lactonase YvrE
VIPAAYRDSSRATSDGALLAVAQPRHHAVVLFDSRPMTPRPIFAFGRHGRQAGEFVRPTGVALSARRNLVYVSDSDNHRIEVFRIDTASDGTVRTVDFVKAIGRRGSQPGEFFDPAGLALDADGNLYVCDTGNARVQVFDPGLAFMREWGGAGSPAPFVAPLSIAVEPSSDLVLVSDVARLEVRAFDRKGTALFTWGAPRNPHEGLSAGEFGYPFGLALAPHAVAFVGDTRRQDIQKFRRDTLIKTFGGPGMEDGRFFQPEGIALIDAKRLVVIDHGGHRGQLFSLDGAFLASFSIPAGDLFPSPTPANR